MYHKTQTNIARKPQKIGCIEAIYKLIYLNGFCEAYRASG